MKYRIEINMIENGYVDIEAEAGLGEAELRTLADEEAQRGGFIGTNSYAEIGKVIINE